ncbi:MAG: M81 family metallopeptidase [Ruminococcaceae bacterium]|nr:M81 family metallopeptidase [Oscillospiraceae bacterium]
MKKRILVCEFHQETNTFNPLVTPAEQFNSGHDFEGSQVFRGLMTQHSAVHGGVDAITEAGGDAVPCVFMHAGSGGRVADSVLAHFCQRMEAYAQEEPFDGIYAALHGATCTESDDDACGTILAHLRHLAGNKPIAASFDLHANITETVLKNADILCGYHTYPHNDYYETGRRAASLCIKILTGETFFLASSAVPMLIPPAGYTSSEGAFHVLMENGKAMVQNGTLLDFSVFPVQPWLDIPEIASRVIAVAGDSETAKACAEKMAQALADLREDAQPELLSVDEIIDLAEQNSTGKPVILSEPADSPNGGCVGDSPVVAMRLLERGSKLRAGMFVRDPAAVKQAFALGVGGSGEFSVGAGFTPGMPGPLKAVGTVCSLHDGYFWQETPAGRGPLAYLGPSAVVRFGTVDILLCHHGEASGNPQLYRHFGIEPTLYDLIVVKANTSFRLHYSKFTDLIYCADTPGAGSSSLKQMRWNKLPAGLYPFTNEIRPENAKIW